jgi:hypothetical protein
MLMKSETIAVAGVKARRAAQEKEAILGSFDRTNIISHLRDVFICGPLPPARVI